MNEATNLHPVVVALMRDFNDDAGSLMLTVEQFQSWYEKLKATSLSQRPLITRDLAVLAARFQREAKASTEWAVHALMFFAIQLSAGLEEAERILAAEGLVLSPEALRLTQAAEAQKSAPPPRAGRSRNVDPMLQQQHFVRRR